MLNTDRGYLLYSYSIQLIMIRYNWYLPRFHLTSMHFGEGRDTEFTSERVFNEFG